MLICIVIPHFDHIDQFRVLLPELVDQKLPLVVVDDASPDQVFDELAQMLDALAPESILIRHTDNIGKGGAVMTGLEAACEAGFTHAVQIDADGQHDVKSISQLISLSARHPNSIICGQPVFDESVSKFRFYARYITLFFTWLETLSTEIQDALCGFRLYPVKQTIALLKDSNSARRMAFDPEILVRAIWVDMPLCYVRVKVRYPKDGKSHFRYFRDNMEIFWMHTRLIFGMLIRLPRLVRRNLSRKRRRTVQ
jgi:glycosyltransferase involved in cell wall biosynthesis